MDQREREKKKIKFARSEVRNEHHTCMETEESRSRSTGRNVTVKTQLLSKAGGICFHCHTPRHATPVTLDLKKELVCLKYECFQSQEG